MRLLVLAVCTLLLPAMARADGLVVFAASSLKAALDPAAEAFEADRGAQVTISYASSPALAQQVDQGAPADVVLLAAIEWMDYLQERQRIVPETRTDLWSNGLSLVAHNTAAPRVALDGSAELSDYLGDGVLAMALVASVPVGRYGKQALERIGQWASVEPQVVQAQDARATLALVASGQAEFGLVYVTDALALTAQGQGIEVGRFPETAHDPILYPGAVVAGSAAPDLAQEFLAFLQAETARGIFAAQGYVIVPQ